MHLDPTNSYRTVELPCSKFDWEARDATSWAQDFRPGPTQCTLWTVGDLMDVQLLGNSEQLDKWNANADGLGNLMSLVRDMVSEV